MNRTPGSTGSEVPPGDPGVGPSESVLPQRFEIELVLRSSGGSLVPHEFIPAEETDRHAIKLGVHPSPPSLIEVDAADLGQKIDPIWGSTELGDATFLDEVSLRQALPRESERVEGGDQPLCILSFRPHEDVDVPGESRKAVKSDGVAADDDELNPVRDE